MDWRRSHGHMPHSSMNERRRSCLLSHWGKLGVLDGWRATFDLLALVWRYCVCHVLLLVSVSPVAIRVDPTVGHLLQPDRETSTDHTEPVKIIQQHLRLATGAFACRRAQTDPRPRFHSSTQSAIQSAASVVPSEIIGPSDCVDQSWSLYMSGSALPSPLISPMKCRSPDVFCQSGRVES